MIELSQEIDIGVHQSHYGDVNVAMIS